MPGAIPSGSDPTGWEAGTPGSNPAQGYDPSAAAGAIVGTAGATVPGQITGVGAGLSTLKTRTLDVITAAYQDLTQRNETLNSYSSQVFDGLELDGNTSPFAAFLRKLGEAFGIGSTTTPTGTGATASWLASIEKWGSALQAADEAADGQIKDFLKTGDWADLKTAMADIIQGVFGTFAAPGVANSIQSSRVTNITESVQPLWDFPDAAAIVDGSGAWTWDGTQDHTGAAGSGSAQVVADGTFKAMRGVPVPVQPGQVLNPQSYVTWSGVEAPSGTSPFQMQLVPFSGPENALVAGTPFLPDGAEITSPGAGADWTVINGSYTVPAEGVTAVQLRIVVTEDATGGGTVNWDDCTENVTGGYLSILENDLETLKEDSAGIKAAYATFLQSCATAIASFTDWATFSAALQAAWSTYTTTVSGLEADEVFTLQQLFSAVFGIDPNSGLTSATHVEGVGGFADMESTLTGWINQLGAALNGNVAGAGDLTWLAQLMSDIGVNPKSPLAGVVTSAQTSAQILATVDNCPVSAGLENTVESNGQYQTAATLSGELVAKTTSRGTFITVSQAKTLGFVQWIGEYTAAPTGFVINFYKMDGSGNLDLLFSSPDLSTTIFNTVQWYLWDIPTVHQIAVQAGDVIAVEFQITTTGTVNAFGYTAPVAGNHPSAAVKQLGFSQNWAGAAASTIASGSIGWSQYAPYVGLGVGTPPPTPYFPQQTPFPASGTHTALGWSNFIDLVGVGGGGGGEGEILIDIGAGGVGGTWVTQTLTVGVTNTVASGMDIPVGGVITVTVGQGGAAGPYFTPGSPGTATTFSWVDMAGATQTVTAAGGLGGQLTTNPYSYGLSPGNISYQGQTYVGGPDAYGISTGNAPGGGGAGGKPLLFGFAGAAGQGWTVDRQ
jgi:hypothetical protein